MAELTAKLSGVDGLSGIFEKMANAGKKAAEYLESAGKAANAAFSQAAASSNRVIETAQKAQDAVKSQSTASEQAAKASVELSKAANAVTSTYTEMQDVLERTSQIAQAAADSDKLAAETKNKLAEADNNLLAAAKKLTQVQDEAARAAENLTRVTRSEETSQNEIEKATKQAAKAADDLARANESAAAATRKAGQAADEAAVELKENSIATVEAASQALAGAGFAALIGVIKDSFKAAVGSAIEFESAITGVYKTVDGNSSQLANIRNDIKAMSTEMPASASSIASVAEAAGQLGVATNDITKFTKVMINLGEATNLSADEAASSLAKFTNITGMSAQNYERLGSTVVALGNNFATTEADIVAMSTRMASAGTLAGLTEPQILAIAASMSSVGIEAEAGGSAMSKLLTDIQIAVETGSDRLNEFASVAGMTGSEFAHAFGDNAAGALQSFISGLNDTARNGKTATVILEDMGLTEVRLSNAVKSLANNSDGLNSAIELANSAWQENTALTTEAGLRYSTLESRISMAKNAATNLSAAVGDDLTPIIGGFVDAGTGVMKWLTGIVDKYPAVSAVITGVSTAFVAVSAAMTVLSVVKIPALATALSALVKHPAILIASAAVGVIVGIGVAISNLTTEYDTWTASTKQQYDELQRLNAEYDNAVAVYGETKGVAQDLRYQIDELTGAFEANKQTFEQFQAQHDALMKSHNDLMQSYASASAEIKNEELGINALITKLTALTKETGSMNGAQSQISAIIEKLNSQLPNLELSYDKVTQSTKRTISAIKEAALEYGKQRQQELEYSAYADALIKQEELKNAVTKAGLELDKERELQGYKYNESLKMWTEGGTFEGAREGGFYSDWTTRIDELKSFLAQEQFALEENQKRIAEIEDGWEAQTAAQEKAAEATAHITDALTENEKVLNVSRIAHDALTESHNALTESYYSSMASISAEENSVSILMAKLAALSSKTSLTASEQAQMAAVTSKLNSQMPGLALSYDKATGALNRSVESMREAAKFELDKQKNIEYTKTYVAALEQEATAREELAKRTEAYNAVQEEYNRLISLGESPENLAAIKAQKDEAMQMMNESRNFLRESQIIQTEIENFWIEQANAIVGYETATRIAALSVTDDLQKLADSYDKAYDSAYNSISGTVGLFNEMKTESDLSTQKMLDNMKSQLDFIEKYEHNIQEASRYGISDALVASLSDGSKESAGYIDAIVKQYEKLYWQAPEKATAFVAEFNKGFEGVQTAKDSFSTTVAEMQTDFDSELDKMQTRMNEMVDGMNMETEAANAAKSTIDAYIAEIEAGVSRGQTAAESLANAVKNTLTSGGVYTAGLPGGVAAVEANANGTTNAADVFIAGERGPELIVGMGGSTVFPAEETAKIFDAWDKMQINVPVPENLEYSRTEISETRNSSVKTVNINLNGSGEIKVDGNLSDDDVWEIVATRLKPEFIRIIRQDIFEEGDRAYDF